MIPWKRFKRSREVYRDAQFVRVLRDWRSDSLLIPEDVLENFKNSIRESTKQQKNFKHENPFPYENLVI